jgi:hypothetical protein
VAVADGTLLQGRDGTVYIVQAGRRRLVPDPYTVRASGLDPRRVEVLADRDLASLPLGVPLARTERTEIDSDSHLGLGHYVTTHGVVHPGGHIDAQTRTRSLSWFCGYHSGVYLLFADAAGSTIGSSTLQVFGVDGAWMGRSDRTDYWGEEIDPDVAARTRTLAVAHTGRRRCCSGPSSAPSPGGGRSPMSSPRSREPSATPGPPGSPELSSLEAGGVNEQGGRGGGGGGDGGAAGHRLQCPFP